MPKSYIGDGDDGPDESHIVNQSIKAATDAATRAGVAASQWSWLPWAFAAWVVFGKKGRR